MLALAFFLSVFSSLFWLIYAGLFVADKLGGIPLAGLSLFDAALYTSFLLLPVFLIVFSSLFQLTGVWCAYPATQVVLSVIALVLQSPNLVADHEKKIVEVSI